MAAGDDTAIGGASGDAYTVQAADATHGVSCRVTAENAGGSENATSGSVDVPAVAPQNTQVLGERKPSAGPAAQLRHGIVDQESRRRR